MTLVKDIRKTVTDTTPVYAVVGVTDLAVETLRDARARAATRAAAVRKDAATRAAAVRKDAATRAAAVREDAATRAAAVRVDLDITAIQDKAVRRFEKVTEQVQQIPAQVRSQSLEAAGKARETYSVLAVRGEKTVKRLRNQKSTKDLFAQAGSTVSLGKGAVTTVRKAAHDTQHAARVTLATGRREAGDVASSVQNVVRPSGRAAQNAPAATPTVVQGTGTPAKKSTASAERATRSVAARARKTTTKHVTPKVGD